jgi:hypothetical protein
MILRPNNKLSRDLGIADCEQSLDRPQTLINERRHRRLSHVVPQGVKKLLSLDFVLDPLDQIRKRRHLR